MKFGTTIRNQGPAATTANILQSARYAEAIGLDSLWVVDHIAIPPDDAEGSEGRWFDPLATLAYLAAATDTVQLGVSVLVLPYRPALPTAKWIATIQELSNGRLHLGIGPGWMQAEFTALGVDKSRRGEITDETIDFVKSCFETDDDIANANGQQFYFRPKPACPPIYVGGMTDKALERTIRCADGWLPMGIDPEKLSPRIATLKQMANAAGRKCPDVITIGTLPDDDQEAIDKLNECAALGVSHYIQSSRYADIDGFRKIMERLQLVRGELTRAAAFP
ncbi:MAG: TIGR03619 family F420-dependent LLM class oxidoreductase [Gammaproteobacteria bacterium]